MIDARTAEYVSPSWIENVRLVDRDGMLSVVADYKSDRMVPRSVILWEPSLMRLPTENQIGYASAQLDRISKEVSS